MPKDNSEEIAFPQIVNLDTEMRKIVLADAKFLLARLKQKGLIDAKVEYRDIIFTPKLMKIFSKCFGKILISAKIYLSTNAANVFLIWKHFSCVVLRSVN